MSLVYRSVYVQLAFPLFVLGGGGGEEEEEKEGSKRLHQRMKCGRWKEFNMVKPPPPISPSLTPLLLSGKGARPVFSSLPRSRSRVQNGKVRKRTLAMCITYLYYLAGRRAGLLGRLSTPLAGRLACRIARRLVGGPIIIQYPRIVLILIQHQISINNAMSTIIQYQIIIQYQKSIQHQTIIQYQ